MVGYAILKRMMNKKKPEEDWLDMLLKSKFFRSCSDHQELRKNEMNVFCIDCIRCICHHCISSTSHCLHNLLQIRRYVYHDVVRLHDMQKHIDCAGVQTYTINGAKVVFLNPRPQPRPSKSNYNGASCIVCERCLSEPNQYCSIACKVSMNNSDKSSDGSSINSGNLTYLSIAIPEFDALSVKENQNAELNSKDEVESWSSEENRSGGLLTSSALLKPKKQMNKRKGIPHRAPLC